MRVRTRTMDQISGARPVANRSLVSWCWLDPADCLTLPRFLAVVLLFGIGGVLAQLGIWIFDARIYVGIDPDDTMRLVEVRDFLAGQGWFSTSPNVPGHGGTLMHWSRLVDWPIAGATPFMDFSLGRSRRRLRRWPPGRSCSCCRSSHPPRSPATGSAAGRLAIGAHPRAGLPGGDHPFPSGRHRPSQCPARIGRICRRDAARPPRARLEFRRRCCCGRRRLGHRRGDDAACGDGRHVGGPALGHQG